MFRLIEADWDRKRYPLTYRMMGELLSAQVDSQLQLAGPLHGNKGLNEHSCHQVQLASKVL
jgi:hypothetical protein